MINNTTTVSTVANGTDDANVLKSKRILKALALKEVVVGCATFILGVATTAVAVRDSRKSQYRPYHAYFTGYGYYYSYIPHAGEGIWCAAVMIIAGGLGIAAGKPNSSKCMVSAHMGMSIAATVFSGGLLIADACIAASTYGATKSYIALLIIIASLAFVNVVLFITSAVYCCMVAPCSDACCSTGGTGSTQHAVYLTNPTSGQPQFVQLPNGQQVPIAVMPQSGMPTTSGLQQPGTVMMQQPAIVTQQQYVMSQPALIMQNPSNSQQQQAAFASQNPDHPEKQGVENAAMNYGMPTHQLQQQHMHYTAHTQVQQQVQQQQQQPPPKYTSSEQA